MNTILQARDLTIGYQRGRHITPIAMHLNTSLNAGELVCLIGANGIGKSTLMRTLAGMQPALAGDIRLNGTPLNDFSALELAQQISLVLTERLDVGMLTGHELVALGRHPYTDWLGTLREEDKAAIQRAIHAVGGEVLAQRAFNELSDGERQKILIARALAQETVLMILDEPTAFLDVPRRAEIMHMLKQLAHNTGRAILLSTHDLELALRTADRVWLFSADRRLHIGAPEDLILSGHFARAFADQQVRFDAELGGFSMASSPIGSIRLIGTGVGAIWTRRALERAGYQLDDNAPNYVEVLDQGWRGVIDGETGEWKQLGDLVDQLHAKNGAHQ